MEFGGWLLETRSRYKWSSNERCDNFFREKISFPCAQAKKDTTRNAEAG